MLSVRIELDGAVVILQIGVLHPRLERSGKPQVHRKIQKRETVGAADIRRVIRGSVIHHDEIVLRAAFL